ncbi:MAG TPA: hypothetical protein VMF63_07080 [Opitutaceae bacterium]|nr:hypothetical protein [Opitutaceae bacterium]
MSEADPAPARDGAPRRRLQLAVGGGLLALVFALRFGGVPVEAAAWWVTHLGYWTTLLGFALAVWFLVRLARSAGGGWRQHRWGLLAALLGGAFLQLLEPHRLRVMYDEYALLTTSLDMHRERSAATVSYAVAGPDGRLRYLGGYVEKRQLFFPFLLSLVHDLTGYRPENAFVLNALVGAAFLGAVFWAGRLLGGGGVGVLGVLLAAGLPLVAQNATGGGYDLLAATLLILLFVQAVRCVRAPTRPNAELLVILALLAVQVRDESWLLGLLAAAVLAWGWWRTRRVELSWFLALSPLLLLTPLAVNRVYFATPAFFESVARGVDTFGWHYFQRNLGDALAYLYGWNGTQTNSPLLSWLGTAALLLCLVNALRRLPTLWREGNPLLVLVGFAGFAAAVTGLVLCYFWGQFTDPAAARLSFPLQAVFLLAILGLAPRLLRTRRRLGTAQGVAALFVLAHAVPVEARHAATDRLPVSLESEWAVAYTLAHGDAHTLFVAYSALPLLCHGRPAIPLGFLTAAPKYFDFLIDDPVYHEVLALEVYRRDAKTGAWVPIHDELTRYCQRRGLALEPVAEKVFVPGYESRISRLARPAAR